ncbi:MAG: ABC transporter substrate-binding protein [Spirochaetales bacterium]|nr:ABC transporter substrate-binding protein [Spirochaetales bacterium]
MKKLLLGIAFIMAAISGCQKNSDMLTVGISKIVTHPALDAIEQAIQDEFAHQGITNVRFDLQNANGDVNTAATIANKFKAEKVDIAVGIATPTAVALANTLRDIPVVYAAVTDPVGASLVESFDKGGTNVTGVSDMTPVKEQIMMLNRIRPLKALGHVYSSGETNAVILAGMAKEACRELGIEFIEATVTNSSEVKQAAQAIIDKVDGMYVSTDNTVVSALASLTDVAVKNGVPIMSADPSSAETFDILIAWGFDYYKMGRATGRMVKEILDGKKTEDIPTMFMTDPSDIDLLVNIDLARKLGIEIPEDIIASANKIVENGTLTTK